MWHGEEEAWARDRSLVRNRPGRVELERARSHPFLRGIGFYGEDELGGSRVDFCRRMQKQGDTLPIVLLRPGAQAGTRL